MICYFCSNFRMDKKISIDYKEFSDVSFLSNNEKELVSKARLIAEKAYSPYSRFKVGATVLLDNGQVIEGNNQENAAFSSGICAERVALFFSGANFPTIAIKTIVVSCNGDLLTENQFITPCGSCRQVMLESENRQSEPIKIILTSQNGRVLVFNSAIDLLPFSFGF